MVTEAAGAAAGSVCVDASGDVSVAEEGDDAGPACWSEDFAPSGPPVDRGVSPTLIESDAPPGDEMPVIAGELGAAMDGGAVAPARCVSSALAASSAHATACISQ